MDKIKLQDNHRRSVSAAIYMIEKIIRDLEKELRPDEEGVLLKIIHDINTTDLQHYEKVLLPIKSHIRYLAEKYGLNPHEVLISRLVNAKKTGMWEILCDTNSKRMKGYGDFPEEFARELDSDIDTLLNLIAEI